MNKKLVIGIAAAVVLVGGIVAAVALKNKGGEENQPVVEVDSYSVESATSGNKVNFTIAQGLGYKVVEGAAKGSLILENETNHTKLTFYYKYADKKSIIGGEKSYAGSYYDYSEYEVNGHEACSVKKNKQEDDAPWRIEFNMILGESETDSRYDGVAIYLENTAGSDEESTNIEQLFAGEDMRKMLESITLVKE